MTDGRDPNIRVAVWNGLLDSGRQERYYLALSARHGKRHSWMTMGLFIGGTLEGGLVLVDAPEIAVFALGAVIGVIAMLVKLGDYAVKSAVMRSISLECSYMTAEWGLLWTRIDNLELSDKDILVKHKQLTDKMIAVTGRSTIQEDRKLNEKCWDESITVMEGQYA